MHVFVTGASGHLGAVVVRELLAGGHSVVGLARSDSAATKVERLGATVYRGSLAEPAGLAEVASVVDGVIHLAFDHDSQNMGDLAGAVDTDLAAVRAFGDALAGSGRPFIGTNATGALSLAGHQGLLRETDGCQTGPRIDAENVAVGFAERDIRASVVRLPPTVHGEGRHGFVSALAAIASATGRSAYTHGGLNRWPSAHVRDVARLYCRALETAPSGSRLHAVAEPGIAIRNIAEILGHLLRVPTAELSAEASVEHFGALAPFVLMDNPTSSEVTRAALEWQPSQPTLLEDLATDPHLATLGTAT